MAPLRGEPFGGIEFEPGDARRVLLAGDETAVPAICAILRDLPPDAVGAAFLEVPDSGRRAGRARAARRRGHLAAPRRRAAGRAPRRAVTEHLGAPASIEVPEDEVDPDLWETPAYSSSSEVVSDDAETARLGDLYAWIAGESKVVTGLRRNLVSDLGMHRRRVAFMGYWRRGVAMRS